MLARFLTFAFLAVAALAAPALRASGDDGNDKPVFTADSEIFGDEKFTAGYVDIPGPLGLKGEMFYWYFPSRRDEKQDPLVLWLTGGPGCASELAALGENGPFWVNKDATLRLNAFSWTNIANVIYVDQPLGTGFSKAHFNVALNEEHIAKAMRHFFIGFLKKFPDLANRPFYLTGESYAGHFVPSIAAYLLKNPVDGLNVQGMAIGNGWVDPYTQFPAYADYAFEEKLISETSYKAAQTGFKACQQLIKMGNTKFAIVVCNGLMRTLLGSLNPYDIRLKCEHPPLCYDMSEMEVFLNKPEVQKELNVKKKWKECRQWVHLLLTGDFLLTTIDKVAEVAEAGKRVLIYNGDKDFICNWKGGLDWLHEMEWSGKQNFVGQELGQWSVEGSAAGSVKREKNVTFLRVFDAGHMVPMDQSKVALAMLNQFLLGNLLGSSAAPAMDFGELSNDRDAVHAPGDVFGNAFEVPEVFVQ